MRNKIVQTVLPYCTLLLLVIIAIFAPVEKNSTGWIPLTGGLVDGCQWVSGILSVVLMVTGVGFLVAILDLLEPGATLVVQGGILFGLIVELHIQAQKLGNALFLDLLLGTPGLVGVDHLAELGAPVAQVIDAHGLVAQEIVDALQAVADHGGGQVSHTKALGDVDGGIVQAHGLAIAHVGGTVLFALGEDGLQRVLGKVHAVEEEIHIAVHGLHAGHIGMVPALAQGLGDLGGSHAQRLGQAEHGESVIAHVGIRGNSQQAANLVAGGQPLGIGPGGGEAISRQGGNAGHHIHTGQTPLHNHTSYIIPYIRGISQREKSAKHGKKINKNYHCRCNHAVL